MIPIIQVANYQFILLRCLFFQTTYDGVIENIYTMIILVMLEAKLLIKHDQDFHL